MESIFVKTHLYSTFIKHSRKTTSNKSDVEVYSDISGLDINGGTIPPDILATQLRPDLVILNRQDKIISLLELTCSFEHNAEAANLRKTLKYTALKSDLEDKMLVKNLISIFIILIFILCI